jgi:phage repressor protein C with HTH and peptisase S24 domain
MQKIAGFLNAKIEWLQYGEGEPGERGYEVREQKVAKESNVISADFSGRAQDMVDIPRLSLAGSMGSGLAQPEDHVDVIERIRVSTGWLRRNINASSPANLAVITGYGDSMEGTFSDGDLLLVDRGITEIKIDAVYVLSLKGELYIKRLQRRPDGVLLMLSDNEKYKPYEIRNGDLEQFQVLGRVLLAWNAKRL